MVRDLWPNVNHEPRHQEEGRHTASNRCWSTYRTSGPEPDFLCNPPRQRSPDTHKTRRNGHSIAQHGTVQQHGVRVRVRAGRRSLASQPTISIASSIVKGPARLLEALTPLTLPKGTTRTC